MHRDVYIKVCKTYKPQNICSHIAAAVVRAMWVMAQNMLLRAPKHIIIIYYIIKYTYKTIK